MGLLEKTLLYAGLDREEFNALKDDALAETRRSLRVYSMFATFLFIVMAIFEWVTNGHFAQNIGIYFVMSAICAFVWIVTRHMAPTHPDLILPLAYLLVTTMYMFALILTMLHTDLPAVTFIAMLVLAPFLFTDRPIYIILLNIAATAALCVLSWMFKPQSIAIGDEWNGITLCAVSVAAAIFQRRLRFRALAQARQIRYLSETDVLTGAKNRNKYEQVAAGYPSLCKRALVCAFADVNGLHEMNNAKGHRAGDVMLQAVGKALLDRFGSEHVYRIGGDEFVAFAPDAEEAVIERDLKRISAALSAQGYDISVGVVSGEKGSMDLERMLADAEKEMYRKKELYYQQPEHERRKR
ncbi:MAG: GGDEF domain-containing protein [Clostridia bacterium]|nr:GGDEF domain-containing protein [Clostridia bacterium]